MSAEPFWKQLADTRHRVQKTKLQVRIDAANAAMKGAEEETKFAENIDYPNGKKALRFDDSGSGFVYYKSGNVAVCVSRFNEHQHKYFIYGDDTKGTLIGFSSEKSEGFALSSEKKVLWSFDGGSIVGADGTIQKEWRWDATKQNAGTRPTSPVTVHLNECISCTFLSRQNVTFKFMDIGVMREFDCSEKLRRYDSYLDHSSKDLTGRIEVSMNNPVTLQDRLAKQMEDSKLQRAKLNPKSHMISNPGMNGVIKSLEEHFFPYEERIRNESNSAPPSGGNSHANGIDSEVSCNYVSTSINGDWHGDASRMTSSEVDAIKTNVRRRFTQKEEGKHSNADIQDFYWQKNNGKLMNNIEILEALLEQHPVLPQPALVAKASGRYLAGSKPPVKKTNSRRLLTITHRNFDDIVQGNAKTGRLVFIACMRSEVGACRKAQLILEVANGKVYEQAAQKSSQQYGNRLIASGGDGNASIPVVAKAQDNIADKSLRSGPESNEQSQMKEPEPEMIMCHYDMAASRLLQDRYGIQSVPTYLMFYAGKLVYGGTLGGAPITLQTGQEPPHVLLVEPSIKDQIIIEKIMKKEGVRCDLALSASDVQHHVSLQRSRGLGTGKRRFHGVVILGDGLSDSDIASITSTFAGMEGTLIVSLCPRQSVKVAKGVIYRVISTRNGSRQVRTAQTFKHTKQNIRKPPRACLSTGVIWNAEQELLRGGKAHVAVMKPFKASSLDYLVTTWKRQDFRKDSTMMSPSNNRKKQNENEMGHLDASHMGLSAPVLIAKMKSALSDARKGFFLPDHHKLGLSLSASESTVRGTLLKK